MMKKARQGRACFFVILLTVAAAGVFVFCPATLALTKEEEIKTAYRDVLDRLPTAEELKLKTDDYPGFLELKKELNKLPERDEAIKSIYQRALKRDPRPDELDFLKRVLAANNSIRERLFSSQERILAIKDLYVGLLGRQPDGASLDFYFRTRSAFHDIKKVLNESAERKEAIKKVFWGEVGREPTEAESKQCCLESVKYLSQIRLDLRNLGATASPIISNLQAGISETSAVIMFSSDKKSVVKLEYGVSSQYGETKEINNYAFNHNLTLPNLEPGKVYYYRLTVTDTAGNKTVSEERNFVTKGAVYAAGVPFYQRLTRWNSGPASVQMLLEHHGGIKEEQDKIAEEILAKLPVFDVYFAFPDNIISYIKSKGLGGTESYASVNPQNTTLDYLKKKIDEKKPVLVKVQTGFSESYKVLVGYTDSSKEFLVNDPAKTSANYKIKYDKFLEEWSSSPIYNPLYKNWSFVIE